MRYRKEKEQGLREPGSSSLPYRRWILVLEDQGEIRSLIVGNAEHPGAHLRCRGVAGEARGRFVAKSPYDIFFLDVNLPDGCGLTLAEESARLASHGRDHRVQRHPTAVQAIRDGAIDFITKPFSVGDFLQRLDKAVQEWKSRTSMQYYARALENLVAVKAEELSRTSRQMDEICDMTVAALGAALNLKDHETSDHCTRVSRNSVRLGEALSPLRVRAEEPEMGRLPPRRGEDRDSRADPSQAGGARRPRSAPWWRSTPSWDTTCCSGIEFLRYATDVVLSHHESFDGSGYPNGLKGTDIPLHARIFAVMDALDAMTSERPYRPALPLLRRPCASLSARRERSSIPRSCASRSRNPNRPG